MTQDHECPRGQKLERVKTDGQDAYVCYVCGVYAAWPEDYILLGFVRQDKKGHSFVHS